MAEQNGFLNIGDGAIPGNATVSGYEGQTIVSDPRQRVPSITMLKGWTSIDWPLCRGLRDE